MKNKVSIIIPTYNRAHLIGETLDSIIAQNHQNWECIIVDDGSTDDSENLIKKFQENDNRFIFLMRPNSKPKGANTCRNIGLDTAKGDYIVFFDSDDLMTPDHLEIKVNGIQNYNFDYVITRTKFFNSDLNYMDDYYQFDKHEITPYNYVCQKNNWVTLDVLIKSDLAKSIRFNENLQSGQEYNYYSKLVHSSCNAKFIDKVVSLRRYHEKSIRTQLHTDNKLQESFFRANWHTYLDLRGVAKEKTLKVLLIRCVKLVYENKAILISNKFLFCFEIFKLFKVKGTYFMMMYLSLKFFNKGDIFKNKFLRT